MRSAFTTRVTLSGRHVRLEPLELAHVPGLVAAASRDRATFAFTTVPDGEDAMRAYVAEAVAARDAGLAVPFATVAVGAGGARDQVVGATRFCALDRFDVAPGGAAAREAAPDGVEIGWTWLAPSAQRTAVNTEAKLLMLAHAFEAWGVLRVTLKTDARNARSRAAIARLGARLDGVLRAHMRAADGTVRDSAFYSVVAAEWPAAKDDLARRLSRRES